MSRRQQGEGAPGDPTRWRDGLVAALALAGFAAGIDALAHWGRWPVALIAALEGG